MTDETSTKLAMGQRRHDRNRLHVGDSGCHARVEAMRASRRFNARKFRQIRDFTVTHREDGSAVLYLLADRAEDPAEQAALEQTRRLSCDVLKIDLSGEDIEKMARLFWPKARFSKRRRGTDDR